MGYGIHSKNYLDRARKRLDEGTLEALFYAAFELRCGVEARLQQYKEAHKNIVLVNKKEWRISRLANALDRLFRNRDKIARVDISDATIGELRISLYYTPVNKKLKQMAGEANKFMHHPVIFREPHDHWWSESRDFLEAMYKELSKANKGTLLGPPLLNPVKNTASFGMEIESERFSELQSKIGKIGERLHVTVSYIDELPE